MTRLAEFDELACTLPAVRVGFTDAGEYAQPRVEPCGHPLHVKHHGIQYLLAGGVMDGHSPRWEVVCEAGHVLVVVDDEGNDVDVPVDDALLVRTVTDLLGVRPRG